MQRNPTQDSIQIRVRYAEVDAMGALHHSRYWIYFEIGRTELLRKAGIAYRDLESQGVFFVVAKCAARFKLPARYDDQLILTTTIEKMGLARIDHSYRLTRNDNGALIATAQTTLACVGTDGRPRQIPEQMRVETD